MRLLAALSFLTRWPIRRPFEAKDVGRGSLFFPLVGAGIGLSQLVLFVVLRDHLSAVLVGVLVIALSAWITRGLHLDGLADFADGLGGGRAREDVLRIMHDPRLGSFGATALFLVLAVKIAAVASLRSSDGIVLAPAVARWTSVPLAYFLPYAREGGGLGAALTDHVGLLELLGATVLVAALALVFAPKLVVVAAVAALAMTALNGLVARRRLGGITGDVLGANTELAESVALVVAVLS
jgi:adenosylcobinamide-GDP ribazoletransferase